ncbi:hypothetical protein CsSME_00001993 [Camellia sinensis var. sinensis]
MDLDNIECISTSDGMEDEEISSHHPHNHHSHQFSSKPHNNGIAPATSVHELLECPVCTNSMYPPIHQVRLLSHVFSSYFYRNGNVFVFFSIGSDFVGTMLGFVSIL